MDVKGGIEEKRVKSTIIRRRAKAEPVPRPAEETPAEKSPQPVEQAGGAAGVRASGAPQATTDNGVSKTSPQTIPPKPGAGGVEARILGRPSVEEAEEKVKPKKVVKKKSREELDMEMIERIGGLKRAAVELLDDAPERLERVFRPERSSKKKKVVVRKEFRKTEITTPKAIKRVLRVEGMITVGDLSHRMSVKAGDVLKKLMNLGVIATINQYIDIDTAILIAQDFGFEIENVAFTEASLIEGNEEKAEGEWFLRPPIVTVMGHVDHGKTTLLDQIRKTQVAAGEAGGITQHIGAYEVRLPKGSVTFIDTPGHEAFTSMRARGAQVTDVVILVVAADDGIMPQTVEAIHHAKAAKVPIIVAINKIDKPDADIARVERGLMEQGLVSEKLGGDTIMAPVSAKTGQGVDHLLEMALLQAEVMELKANPKKRVVGTIIEARLDKGRGPVATVVIQEGTLRGGDIVVAGTAYGKVRALLDATGQVVEEAGPSKPVEVLGLAGVPLAGDKLHGMESEDDARQLAEHREKKIRELKQAKLPSARLEDLYAKVSQGEVPEFRVIVKGDVQGSIEALRDAIVKLSTEKVRVVVLHAAVGAVTESDVMLAVASRAVIIAFQIRPDAKARELAEVEKVQIRTYNIIYDVTDEIKKAMVGLLKPTYEEKYLGRAEVRQIFTVSRIGTIAGCGVTDGKIARSAQVRLLRDGKVVYQGKTSSLKRFKDDAKEVGTGLECGIGLENFNDLKPGDTIEAFLLEEVAGKL